MKALIVAALLTLSLSSVTAQSAECDPKYPSVSEVEKEVANSKSSGIATEVLSGEELESFKSNIDTYLKPTNREMIEFDKHVYFASPGNPIGMSVMILGECVVRVAPIPLESYTDFRMGPAKEEDDSI